MDRLLFEQAQVDAARSTPSLVPLSVPGLAGGPTVDAKVVVKEPRQVAGILQNHHQVSDEQQIKEADRTFSLFCIA